MTKDIYKRVALFLFGCIGLRCMLVYIAKHSSVWLLRILGYIAMIPAFGFIYIYLTGSRTTGPEVFGDKIWWNTLRPVHGGLYALFAWHAIMGHRNAWTYLFIDVIVGLSSFLLFHLANVSFE